MKPMKSLMAATVLCASAGVAFAQDMSNPKVGGADMSMEMNIVENAMNSPIHKTLVAAVQQAGLVETLQSEGPFTVFAPTDMAFDALPEGTVEQVMMDENKDQLSTILQCHVIQADVMYGAIRGMISDDGGTHPVETLGGCMLQAKMDGNTITLTDENGTTANVLVPDVQQSNGMIHVIDAVMLPAM